MQLIIVFNSPVFLPERGSLWPFFPIADRTRWYTDSTELAWPLGVVARTACQPTVALYGRSSRYSSRVPRSIPCFQRATRRLVVARTRVHSGAVGQFHGVVRGEQCSTSTLRSVWIELGITESYSANGSNHRHWHIDHMATGIRPRRSRPRCKRWPAGLPDIRGTTATQRWRHRRTSGEPRRPRSNCGGEIATAVSTMDRRSGCHHRIPPHTSSVPPSAILTAAYPVQSA